MKTRLVLVTVAVLALGGSARAGLYSPPPGDFHPTWSPDGSAIVFTRSAGGSSYGPLWVTDPDGRNARRLPLPSVAEFAFSNDWRWLAIPGYFENGRPELLVTRPDGSIRYSFRDDVVPVRPSWAPDGRRLAFQGQKSAIVVAGFDGSGVREIAEGTAPAWSPRGDRIAYLFGSADGMKLATVAPDGGDRRVLPRSAAESYNEPRWSPDGSRLAFGGRSADPRSTAFVGVVSADGRSYRRYAVPTRFANTVDWAPDGKRILLSGDDVRVIDLGTGTSRRIARNGFGAVWSPDGRRIAFTAGGECRDRVGIYVADAARGTANRITNSCRIYGTPGNDSLRGTPLADVLLGLGGDDTLAAASGGYVGDTLLGGAGDDTLSGGFWPDDLDGGSGSDALHGGANADSLRGGPGRDVLRGDGGRDVIYARDGERDVVSCGTNASKAVAPFGETDVAYVDRIDVVSRDCEFVYRPGAVLNAGSISLRIRVTRNATKPRPAERTFTLRCRPAGGTLPSAAKACARLIRVANPFAPVPPAAVCTQIYGGPQRAVVTGTFAGKPVRATFVRTNGCEISRWNRVKFLFPVPVGVSLVSPK